MSEAAGASEGQGHRPYTVVALFDETIDAERALVGLQKAHHEPEHVSLIVQSPGDAGNGADQALAVARSLVAVALETVGTWLQGLASLIVPERGSYLVAGPMGAALTSFGTPGPAIESPTELGAEGTPRAQLEADSIFRVLTDFGFGPEEAAYLESRLKAGDALVAVTDERREALQASRRLFADHDAVYLGMTRTDADFFEEAEELLEEPAAPAWATTATATDVIVADAVAPLRRASDRDDLPAELRALRGREVVDAVGEPAGEVDDAIAELVDPDGREGPAPARYVLRYVVVGHGGLLGIGRARVAVPAPLVAVEVDRVRVAVDKETLQRAPGYNAELFSRRDEQATYAYFGLRPY